MTGMGVHAGSVRMQFVRSFEHSCHLRQPPNWVLGLGVTCGSRQVCARKTHRIQVPPPSLASHLSTSLSVPDLLVSNILACVLEAA